ncbi:aminoglycoside phosphotransferase family protein [Litorivita sp. NS0012-18]|uniref:aminoglycoside phosphotransferase family protein n=1 Tax=Litorivita sp. NS0012-18 TaxID=3127655 RepID=UPI00333F8359
MTGQRTQVMQAGRAALRVLAPMAGLPQGGWQVTLLSARREGQGARGVLRADPAQGQGENLPSVIVKLHLPVEPARFEAMRAGHAAAARALPDGVPAALAACEAHGALLLSCVQGEPVWEALSQRADGAGSADMLIAAGAWLGRFHKGAARGAEALQTGGPLRRLRRLAKARDLPQPQAYCAALGALETLGQQAQNPTPHAVIHGDMTLQNLLVTPDLRVCGIDFENAEAAPAMRDLAGLVADDAIWFGAGGAIDLDAQAPLLRGYSGAGGAVDAAALRFFVGAKLLGLWAAQPARGADRTARRAYVWSRLQQITPEFFTL